MAVIRIVAFVVTAASLSAAASADTVHLANGRAFEGVVAREAAGIVTITLDFGEMSLPRSAVARIESTADTALEEFEARRAALEATEPVDAGHWLELGRWALTRGLRHRAASAGLVAAASEPDHPGLDALLEPLGYLRDSDTGAWLGREEALRRRGWVRWQGVLVPPDEAARAAVAAERVRRERASAEREERIDRVLEALVLAELRQATVPAPPEPSPVYGLPWMPWVVVSAPIGPVKPIDPARAVPHRRSEVGGATWNDVARRIPGSSLPLGDPARSNVSRFRTERQ